VTCRHSFGARRGQKIRGEQFLGRCLLGTSSFLLRRRPLLLSNLNLGVRPADLFTNPVHRKAGGMIADAPPRSFFFASLFAGVRPLAGSPARCPPSRLNIVSWSNHPLNPQSVTR